MALKECRSTLPSEDVDEIIEYVNHSEYLLALQSLSYFFVDKNIKFSKVASKYIREAAIAMEINKENKENDDGYWLWEKIEPLLDE
ncbi:MAG: MafI family immunity protein [Bacteroidales bacterium]|nr:MafI family immunity protein [Bacteroidales bacterium]